MKTAGVIAEYNPFHNGHKYQLQEIRRLTGADYITVFMSGDFVQRGTPAIIDKYTRAEMALLGGADLVIQLPAIYSTGSAELFAFGGVSAMKASGIVSCLCFGAENDNLLELTGLSSVLACEPAAYREALQEAMRSGMSFPLAREQALLQVLPDFSPQLLHELVSSPNNILALEYLKAAQGMNFSAEPILIPRIGGDYREDVLTGSYSSATAIRKLLLASPQGISSGIGEKLSGVLPAESLSLLQRSGEQGTFVTENDLSAFLFYALLDRKYHSSSPSAGASKLPADCDRALWNRIMDSFSAFTDFNSFAASLKARNYTYTHICRALIHILLQLTEEDRQTALSGTPYLRVLGFRRSSAAILKELKEQSSVPVITKPSAYTLQLDGPGRTCFEKDLFASELYLGLSAGSGRRKWKNDMDHPMVILP